MKRILTIPYQKLQEYSLEIFVMIIGFYRKFALENSQYVKRSQSGTEKYWDRTK